jgi:D-alanine-D-alanine ligase
MPTLEGEVLTFDTKYRSGAGTKGKAPGIKVSKGGMASLNRKIPAPISDDLATRIQDLALQGFRAIQAHGIARVDFLLDQDGETVYLNEINTMPGSLSFYLWEATGLAFDQLVRMLVEGAVERHKTRRETKFSMDANLLAGAR